MSKTKPSLEEALRTASQQLPKDYLLKITISRGDGRVTIRRLGDVRSIGCGPENESLRDCVTRLLSAAMEHAGELPNSPDQPGEF